MMSAYRFPLVLAILTCLTLLVGTFHCHAEDTDLLSVVRAGHRAARESIRTFSATVKDEFTFFPQKTITTTGKYWRSFDVVHIQEKQRYGIEDYLLKDSEVRQVAKGNDVRSGKTQYRAGRRAGSETLSSIDVWSIMEIEHTGPSGERCDFDRFLEFAIEPPQVRREEIDGRECIQLKLSTISTTGRKHHITFWHDVSHNYLIWKRVFAPDKEPVKIETEILEFLEPSPGVFVPVKCRQQSFRNGERTYLRELTLSDVQVNNPLPKSTLELPSLPRGTILDDHIQRTSYPIDANWLPIGPANPLPQLSLAGNSDDKGSGFRSQSVREPIALSRWLMLGSLIVLIIACAALIYRRYRLHGKLFSLN